MSMKSKLNNLKYSWYFTKKCWKEPKFAMTLRQLCEIAGLDVSTFSPQVKKRLNTTVREIRSIEYNVFPFVKNFIAIQCYRVSDEQLKSMMSKGALCLLTDHQIENLPCIIVETPAKTAALMLKYYRELRPNCHITVITGSIGKTTVTNMINTIYAQQYNTLKSMGNSNVMHHVSHDVQHIGRNTEVMVKEVSESGVDHKGTNYTSVMSSFLKPQVAVLTTITNSHIEKLGSFEKIVSNVCSLTDGMPSDGIVVVNSDEFSWFDKLHGLKTLTVSMSNKEADYSAQNVVIDSKGTHFEVVEKITKEVYSIFLQNNYAIHNVGNALLAFAAGVAAKVTKENIVKGLVAFHSTGIRQNIFRTEDDVVVYADCFNATELSIKTAIEASVKIPTSAGNKRFVVIGDVSQAGELTEETHRNICQYVDKSNFDVFIGKGKEISKAIENYQFTRPLMVQHFLKNEDVEAFLRKNIKKDDFVLLKGSHSAELPEVIQKLWPKAYEREVITVQTEELMSYRERMKL